MYVVVQQPLLRNEYCRKTIDTISKVPSSNSPVYEKCMQHEELWLLLDNAVYSVEIQFMFRRTMSPRSSGLNNKPN
jgi:hypothetical protein